MKNEGLSIHCHHDILIECCTDYQGRIDSIRLDKPKNEQEIRLRLFKLLPEEAMKDLPNILMKAYTDFHKVHNDWQKANADRYKDYVDWSTVYAARNEAYLNINKASNAWPLESKESFHKKWCGCVEWKNGVIIFT